MIPKNLSIMGCHAWEALILFIVSGLVSSCASYPMIQSERPLPVAAEKTNPALSGSDNGSDPDEMSLWTDNTIMADLFSDTKARRVGDIVTIQVSESSSASNSAWTAASVTSLRYRLLLREGRMGKLIEAQMSPASISPLAWRMVTPHSCSSFRMAQSSAEGPRSPVMPGWMTRHT